MRVSERVPLASLTTFKVGGPAAIVAECETEEDVQTALALSRERGLPWYVLGGGSNLVAPDDGYDGLILLIKIPGMDFQEAYENKVIAIVGAGVSWDAFVHTCTQRNLWGIENLAGIPGTVGAAPVQNIGAYGAELADTLLWVDVCDAARGATRRVPQDECLFNYRESRFKHDPSLIITRAAFELSPEGTPRTTYADLARRVQEGILLDTPTAIADAVREIRAKKFPDLRSAGTAGSFFKNPIIPNEEYRMLQEHHPGLPGFPAGESSTKISLAWILDHVLHLKGYADGHVRLFEAQPLVIASEPGATAHSIDALAKQVEKLVLDSTGIILEREVRFL